VPSDLAAVADGALDVGHLANAAAHDHRHALAHVGAGVVVELVAGFVGQREADVPQSGVADRCPGSAERKSLPATTETRCST
jgi:hypothetical protein